MAQGLLLDIGAGTLTVYVNGARKGDMVQPDMLVPPPPGIRVGTLEPPLRWAVDLEHASVEIGGPLPPPLEADSADDDEASSGDEEDDESDEDSDEGGSPDESSGESSDESSEESDDDQEEEEDSTCQA